MRDDTDGTSAKSTHSAGGSADSAPRRASSSTVSLRTPPPAPPSHAADATDATAPPLSSAHTITRGANAVRSSRLPKRPRHSGYTPTPIQSRLIQPR